MEGKGPRVAVLAFIVFFFFLSQANAKTISSIHGGFNRSSFPQGFVFGTASASYQYEGAAKIDGRGPSIWDTFSHKYPDRISDGSNGDDANDYYHRYKKDVQVMKELGTNAFRFSISWSRLLPYGKLSKGVNKEGIKFYNNLINDLLSNGQQPFVTIFHWDLPQALEDEYGGFLSPLIIDDFRDFSELCFKEFGDRVKHWITINEPWTYSSAGYDSGVLAPGRCSKWVNGACQAGNSSTEPYLVGHHMLLAHAAAVKVYRQKYQESQKGIIGITLVCHWMVPYSKTKSNIAAAERAIDFMLGWYMEPLARGKYPESMIKLVTERLPKFNREQSAMVKESFDFIGMNYYTAFYVSNVRHPNLLEVRYSTDSRADQSAAKNGMLIGPKAASPWLHVYPRGIRDLLRYTKTKYNNPLIYITENGVDEFNNSTLPLKEALEDPMRVNYFYSHLLFLQIAIKEGANVKGYFAWSLLDNFEWSSGYTVRFGMNFVDYKNGFKRYPQQSAIWFKNFLPK